MSFMYLAIIQIAVIFISISYVDAISWSLSSSPAIFGENVELKCNLPDDNYLNKTRQWSRDINIIVINGKTADDDKYEETLDESTRTSTLTIKSFDKNDVNIPYSCQYGINEYIDILNMTVESFEKYPENNDKGVEFKDKHISFWMIFKDVTPLPMCTATYGKINITDKLMIKGETNDLFFDVNITLKYHHVSGKCLHDTFNLKCSVGSKTIIQSMEPNKDVCFEAISNNEKPEKDQTFGYVGLAAFSVFAVGYFLFFLVVIIDKTRTEQQKRK